MPPCLDVYVWVPSMEPAMWRWFLDRYVHAVQPHAPQWPSFQRKFIHGTGTPADDESVSDLAWEGDSAVTIYLRGVEHEGSSITITRDGATVLGVSLDDPMNDRDLEDGRAVLADLRRFTGATEGLMGVELPPPQDRHEWERDHSQLQERL